MHPLTKMLLWLLVLPTGVLAVWRAQPLYKHNNDHTGFGMFQGELNANLQAQNAYFFIRLTGHSKPAWRWVEPENYAYDRLDIEWSDSQAVHSGKIDLEKIGITEGAKTSHVDHRWFRNMLVSEPDPTALATEYLKIPYSARNGTLPRPLVVYLDT